MRFWTFYAGALVSVVALGSWVVPWAMRTVSPWYRVSGGQDHCDRGPWDAVEVLMWATGHVAVRCLVWDPVVRRVPLGWGHRKRRVQDKFITTSWLALWYAVLFQTGVQLTRSLDWWPYRLSTLGNLVYDIDNHDLPCALKHYYLVQMSFYLALTYQLLRDERKKDHTMMMSHHLITFVLIFGSYMIGVHRWGTATLLYFDVADIFLYAGKNLESVGAQTGATVVGVVFLVVWVVSRHFFFPYMLVVDGTLLFTEDNEVTRWPRVLIFGALYLLSWVIEWFSILWFRLIVRTVRGKIRGEALRDPRSDSEEEFGGAVSVTGTSGKSKML